MCSRELDWTTERHKIRYFITETWEGMKCYSDVILNIMSFKRFYPQLLEKTNRMCREICNAEPSGTSSVETGWKNASNINDDQGWTPTNQINSRKAQPPVELTGKSNSYHSQSRWEQNHNQSSLRKALSVLLCSSFSEINTIVVCWSSQLNHTGSCQLLKGHWLVHWFFSSS